MMPGNLSMRPGARHRCQFRRAPPGVREMRAVEILPKDFSRAEKSFFVGSISTKGTKGTRVLNPNDRGWVRDGMTQWIDADSMGTGKLRTMNTEFTPLEWEGELAEDSGPAEAAFGGGLDRDVGLSGGGRVDPGHGCAGRAGHWDRRGLRTGAGGDGACPDGERGLLGPSGRVGA